MKSFKAFGLFSCLLLLSLSVSAQKGYYNALLEYMGEEIPFQTDVRELVYEIDGSEVIEYYSIKSDRFLGLKINQESVDAAKLKFVRDNKNVRGLIKRTGLKEAMTFLFDNITPGMTTEEVYSILGKPFKFKYGIDQTSQILRCHFIDSVYDSLVFRDNVLEKITYL